MRFDVSGLPLDQQARAARYELIGVCAQVAGLAWSERAFAKSDPAGVPGSSQVELDALVDGAARELVALLDGGADPLVQAFTDAGRTLARAASDLAEARRVTPVGVPSPGQT